MSSLSKVDEYGFQRGEDFDYKTYEKFIAEYLGTLTRRALRWEARFRNSSSLQKNAILKRFVRKGIPSEYRPVVWMKVSGASALQAANPDLFSSLSKDRKEILFDEIIRNDLNRTFPDNIYFTSNGADGCIGSLFNVLSAFARSNPEIGYCQGLNYIVGLLLIITKNEEQSFWLLKSLVEKILPDYYTKDMKGLVTDIDVLADLVKRKALPLYNLMNKLHLPWAVVVTKWFICLYVEILPIETVLRIWDCLFYEGSKILFRVAITLIRLHLDELLACTEFGDLANSFKNFSHSPSVIDCHSFMRNVFKLPGSFSMSQISASRQRLRKRD